MRGKSVAMQKLVLQLISIIKNSAQSGNSYKGAHRICADEMGMANSLFN